MSEEVSVSKTYFTGLQRNIRFVIHEFCRQKESLDDADIKALENMINVYKTTGFDWVKKWSSDRESFFKERIGAFAEQGPMDIGDLTDN